MRNLYYAYYYCMKNSFALYSNFKFIARKKIKNPDYINKHLKLIKNKKKPNCYLKLIESIYFTFIFTF